MQQSETYPLHKKNKTTTPTCRWADAGAHADTRTAVCTQSATKYPHSMLTTSPQRCAKGTPYCRRYRLDCISVSIPSLVAVVIHYRHHHCHIILNYNFHLTLASTKVRANAWYPLSTAQKKTTPTHSLSLSLSL